MIEKIKRNWLTIVLALIVLYFLRLFFFGSAINRLGRVAQSGFSSMSGSKIMEFSSPGMAPMADTRMEYAADSVALSPSSVSGNRMVSRNTSLSLQVNDVADVIGKIEQSLEGFGGFMVDSNLNRPEMAPSGNITVRVLSDKRQQALDYFKSLGIKTVSENVNGQDITDQYTDVEARLAVLEGTKSKLADLLERYGSINDLMNVQRELLNVQQQIDNLKGREKYLSDSVKYTLVSIYLSTDELALPYAPDNAWRPAVVFKEAVRSLVGNLRNLGSLAIWAVVYSPFLLLIVAIVWYLRKRFGTVR